MAKDQKRSDQQPIQEGGARIPGTPGYESEAAQRHDQHNIADEPEIRSTSLVPEPLEEQEEGEPQVHFETLKWRDETSHRSK